MVTSVLVEPKPGAALQVIILRAAYCTGGGTAELCASGIESKCFARLRQHLTGWRDTCRRLHPDHAWTGPDPELCGLQRLGGGGAFISDTCSGARKTTGLLLAEVARQVKAKYEPAAWAALSEAEQATAITAHATHCWHHIWNIVLKTQSTAQSAHVKEALKEELETFAAYERMTTDFDAVLRADYKELHHGGRYHKGKGKEFAETMRDAHPKAFMMLFERAEGGRQDLDYDASVPMYVNVSTSMIANLHTGEVGVEREVRAAARLERVDARRHTEEAQRRGLAAGRPHPSATTRISSAASHAASILLPQGAELVPAARKLARRRARSSSCATQAAYTAAREQA